MHLIIYQSLITYNLLSISNCLVLSFALSLKRDAAEQKQEKMKDEKEEKKRLEAEKKEQKEREKKEQDARKKFKVSKQDWNYQWNLLPHLEGIVWHLGNILGSFFAKCKVSTARWLA